MLMDIDPLDFLDMNHDMSIDESDLQMYQLSEYGTYGINDLDHDLIMDQFDVDLNNDGFIDEFQADLDNNSVIDQFETDPASFGGTEMNYDINQDGNTDYIDTVLAKEIF